jgi:Zn-dependent protease/CBS domain-containing protein
MFRHTIPIGRISGISVDLDYSWFVIVGLMTWLLAVSYYPVEFRHWSIAEYWLMGGVTAIMLFVSVLIHELGHSVVARRYGISVPRITLFLFGGVSQIATEPPSPGAEFWIAIIGPLVSFALAAFFWALEPFVVSITPLFALAKYLAFLNWILALFNLIPGFPLDGGRVFRAIVWWMTGKLRRATNIAAFTGRFFGFLLIFLGVWQALRGNFFNGLWIAFIGWYLESAAASQLQQEAMKSLIGDHKVLDAMRRDVSGISSDVTLQELVEKFISTGDSRCFIVRGPRDPAGIITLAAVRAVPRAAWPTTTVSQAMIPFHKLATTGPGASLWSALEEMGREGVNQLPVVEGNGIVGMLSREDILHYLGVLRALAA